MTTVTRVDVCMFEVEAWGPHPGCAEFMAQPDSWTCSARAEFIHIVHEAGMPEASDPDQVVNVMTLCREHSQLAALAYHTDPSVVSYTIKPIRQ